ncbi:MAG TPA: aminotransferase class V-fold PLP-dependent enzyme, partial [Vicinamibacteria bacterium]|nr:aminotransferase class V-fold PLP-dependent enzyme [Vicinamibacteria bacterium]
MRLDRREFLVSAAGGVAAARIAPQAFDVSAARADFPASRRATYLNTPYIGPVPAPVEEAGSEFVRSKAESPISLGAMLEKTNEARKKFAELFGAGTHEVGFLFSTSEGENLVTSGLDLKAGDNVVVDDLHYTTSYVLYKTLEKEKGIELRIAPSVEGRADRENFEPLVDAKTRLVSVSWVSHQNGFRHDLKELAALAHAHGALLYADGIQALGMFRTNLREEGVDFVASGTYKWLFASYGVAPFFIRDEHLDRIPPDRMGALSLESEGANHEFRLYPDARKYEYATLAFGAVYQLDAALDYLAKTGLGNIEDHTVPLAREMRRGLADLGFQ